MTRRGWVKFPRELLDDPTVSKDADHLALFVRLLCNAAFEPTPALFGGKRITLQSGQLVTGRKQLALSSGISESKIERALKAFESAQLIEQQTSNKNRLVSVVSWLDLAESEQPDEQPSNSGWTTSEQPANTLEEKKNPRAESKERGSVTTADKPPRTHFSPPTIEDVAEYCHERGSSIDPQRFVDYYAANGWMAGRNKMRDWRAAVRNWERKEVEQSAANHSAYSRTGLTAGRGATKEYHVHYDVDGTLES